MSDAEWHKIIALFCLVLSWIALGAFSYWWHCIRPERKAETKAKPVPKRFMCSKPDDGGVVIGFIAEPNKVLLGVRVGDNETHIEGTPDAIDELAKKLHEFAGNAREMQQLTDGIEKTLEHVKQRKAEQ
jgi:hypothetical protein